MRHRLKFSYCSKYTIEVVANPSATPTPAKKCRAGDEGEALMVRFANRATYADTATTVRPVCSICGAPLWLIRIEPDKAGFARRTLECPRCQNRISEVIELE